MPKYVWRKTYPNGRRVYIDLTDDGKLDEHRNVSDCKAYDLLSPEAKLLNRLAKTSDPMMQRVAVRQSN